MKKPLAIQLEFDITTVRKALVMITGEVLSDEEITAKFFEREPVKIDTQTMFGETESLQLCLSLISMIRLNEQPKEEPQQNSFMARMKKVFG